MVASKYIVIALSAISAASGLVLFLPQEPARESKHETAREAVHVVDITRDYFIPLGSPPETRSTSYETLDWLQWTQNAKVPEDWEYQKSLYVQRCKTPDVFEFCSRSKNLEILQLNVDQSGDRCVLTGVDSLPALRSLRLKIYMRDYSLIDCKAIVRCKKLQCLAFAGKAMTKTDLTEISASKSLECIDLENKCLPGALTALRALPTLRTIRLSYSKAATMQEISEIASLENVILGFDTYDSTSKFSELKKLPNLKFVSMCVKEKEAERNTLKAMLPNAIVRLYDDPR